MTKTVRENTNNTIFFENHLKKVNSDMYLLMGTYMGTYEG